MDGPRMTEVAGSASHRDQENVLRFDETAKYKVVRCRIITRERVLNGLTFRFNGREEKLDEFASPLFICKPVYITGMIMIIS